MDDLFGTPRQLYEEKIKALEDELKSERARIVKFNRLYNAVNNMLAKLGADGDINPYDPEVLIVIEKLDDIGGSTFKELPKE